MGTREVLMKAASDLMLEVGFERMTTSEIARRAGVAEGTIYRHFPGKEALIEAVFADVWRLFNQYVEAHLPPREAPAARLDAFFAVTLQALDAVMNQYLALGQQEHLYFASKQTSSPFCLPPGYSEYIDLLEETIRLAQGVGHVRPEVDPKVTALFLFAGASTVLDTYTDPHGLGGPTLFPMEHVVACLSDLMNRALLTGGAR